MTSKILRMALILISGTVHAYNLTWQNVVLDSFFGYHAVLTVINSTKCAWTIYKQAYPNHPALHTSAPNTIKNHTTGAYNHKRILQIIQNEFSNSNLLKTLGYLAVYIAARTDNQHYRTQHLALALLLGHIANKFHTMHHKLSTSKMHSFKPQGASAQ